MAGDYVTVNGVRTYYEIEGAGEPLVLMHGGFMSSEGMVTLQAPLADRFKVYVPDRRAHGRTGDVDGPISYELMAQDTIAFMEAMGLDSAHLVGYSDGANIGMLIAMSRPELVRKLVLISGNHDADGLVDTFTNYSREATAETFVPAIAEEYGHLSPDGPGHWPVVFEKVRRMFLNEPRIPAADLGRITAPTLVLAADEDWIKLDHSVEQFRSIPGAELAIVPGTSHLLLFEKAELVSRLVLDFLTVESTKIDLGL